MDKTSSEDLNRTLELLKSGDLEALNIMAVCFRERILTDLDQSGIPSKDFTSLFHNILLGLWISANQIDSVETLTRAVEVVTRKTVHSHLQCSLNTSIVRQDRLLSLLDNVFQNTDPKHDREANEQLLRDIHPSSMIESLSVQ